MVLLSTEGLLLPTVGRERGEERQEEREKSSKGRRDGEEERSYVKPLGWELTNLTTLTNLIISICALEMRQLSFYEVK